MNHLYRLSLAAALVGALLSTSCGPGGGNNDQGCRADLLVGDLVITEVMANPDSTDTGREWFEVFVNTTAAVDLTGLRLEVSRADGTGEEQHTVAGLTVDPSDYVTFGSFLEPVPQWLDYSYGNNLGSLRNSDGRVALICDDVVVDEVVYGSTSDGKALVFTGALAPDYSANDAAENWCNASEEYETGSMGSPGQANEHCAGGPNPTECDDAGVRRTLVNPLPGDLVITELMPNPAAADDATAEWFEVYVGRDLDLNGVELGADPGNPRVTLSGTDCLSVTAGSYVVFARTADPATNGGLDAVAGTFPMGMVNGGGSIFVGFEGAVLDAVTWTGSGTGISVSLDPASQDPTSNDDPTKWCPGTGTYGLGDTGTPGAANASCPLVPPPGSCVEGGTTIRAIDPPGAGDLQLTELMANPASVDDALGEWFEVRVGRDLDLNGLEVGTDTVGGAVRFTLNDTACLRATAGSHIVIARETDGGVNGGLPSVLATFDFALVNTNSGLFVGHGGAIIDSMTYASTSSGATLSRDPALATLWCDLAAFTTPAAPTYGLGDKGSPAAVNPSCQ